MKRTFTLIDKQVALTSSLRVKSGIVTGAKPRCLLLTFLLSAFSVHAFSQNNPDGFDTLAASAAAARDNHDVNGAIQLYTQAERLKPTWVSGWWSLGLLQYATQAWPAATYAFSRYIELTTQGTPAVYQAIALRGLCEFQTGDFAQSLTDLESSIARGVTDDPASALLIKLREAQVLSRLGRFDDALGVYGSLAKAGLPNEHSPEWNISAGLAGLRDARLPADIPSSQQPLFAMAGEAALRFMGGDAIGAQQAFSLLFERFPHAENAHYFYGSLLSPTDPDAAALEYKRELEIAPANMFVAAMLARVLLYQAKPAQALPFAKSAANADPASAVAQLVFGRSLAETGDLPGGIEHLEKALELEPGYLETHIALASAYASAGRHQDARRERQQSLAMAEAYRANR